jgi:Transposase, Mutator family
MTGFGLRRRRQIYQALIEAELSSVIGAGPHERTEARTAQRNGHRPKTISTTAGDLELRIPKLRAGRFFPSLLKRRRRVDQSLFAVIMEAYLHGTSTRKVDDLVKALGADTGISKAEVSRICADLDDGGVPRPVAGRAAVPLRAPGRHLLGSVRRGSVGESSDLDEVVGEEAVSAPDSGAADPDEFGAVPALAAFDVVDPALAAGAPLDLLAERSAVAELAPPRAGFASAWDGHVTHAELVQLLLDAGLAVAAVGGH